MIITNGKVRRTVPEQVSENMVEIQKLKDANFVRQDDVVDNLSSHQPKKPLSANQGRILNDKINAGIAGAYKPQGSLTVAAINALDTSLLENGYVFDVLDSGTLTIGSVSVNAGDNIAWIIDNGVGISTEHKTKVFEKFARIDNPLTRTVQGNGLGLYITKSLVEMMDGEIDFESSNEGTTFIVQLPLYNPEVQICSATY